MTKNILFPIALVIIFIVFIGYSTKNNFPFLKLDIPVSTPAPQGKTPIKINETTIYTEVADTNSKRERGLSGRDDLDAQSGMLFVFDAKDVYPQFWMKDMLFGIDIIFIDDDKIVKIYKEVPAPEENDENNLRLYTSDKPIDYVLEVKSGFCRDNNIVEGDQVIISF